MRIEQVRIRCGDHRYLDYSEIWARRQRIRGPCTLHAGLAADEEHLGLTTWQACETPAQTPGSGLGPALVSKEELEDG